MLEQAVQLGSPRSQGRAANTIQFAPMDERVVVRPCAVTACNLTCRLPAEKPCGCGACRIGRQNLLRQDPLTSSLRRPLAWQLYLRLLNAVGTGRWQDLCGPTPRAGR